MEKEINIAEILKNKPKGTKLYSPIFGDVTFDKVEKDLGEYTIFVTDEGQIHQTFMADGRYNRNGVSMLFPSNAMRDWGKFAWKKGDVLVNNEDTCECFFEGWYNDDYTQFKAKHWLDSRNENNIKYLSENQPLTSLFMKEDEESGEYYLNTIEERLDGKLNMETLEIEPNKPKWTPKPFDKVIVRDEDADTWVASLFSHMKGNRFVTINCCYGFSYCLPYNEETAKLIGTTKDYKGGEK